MKYTLFGQGEGVCTEAPANSPYVTVDSSQVVTDVSVSAGRAGVRMGWPLRTAMAVTPNLIVFSHPERTTDTMHKVYRALWNVSPFLRTVDSNAFFLQVPGEDVPLAEVRQVLLEIHRVLHAEQRFRAGLAENPFLAEALVAWSRLERVPGALYYRVRQQQLIVSPGLARWLDTGEEIETRWLEQMPIPALWYIPEKQREQLLQLGVHRLRDLKGISDELLSVHFGKEAWLWRRAMEQVPGGKIQVNYPAIEQRCSWRAPIGEESGIEVVESLMESMAAQLCGELQRVSAGAMSIGVSWRTETGRGSYEHAARSPVYQPFSLIAGLEAGRLQMVGRRLELLDVYVSDLRPLQSVQAGFVLYEDAFYPLAQIERSRMEDVRVQLAHKFPKKLQIGIKPTFREARLAAIERGGSL
ncbi:hypothetical protein NZD89_21305 [Alicyclobacillus fastidiosus]|uniref:UmuC domain-containing protein n=1 Tax=Alicyclobacillus fastidiosus TaxID=392011 RepID=A0ABY6ZD28_9BACL|nr:hypothetical protein [Alicyclobacillus fastidiosus]WAH40808.1 hypothetical protein NZD89_21305 [Alicyclobacillus fastidiosus]